MGWLNFLLSALVRDLLLALAWALQTHTLIDLLNGVTMVLAASQIRHYA